MVLNDLNSQFNGIECSEQSIMVPNFLNSQFTGTEYSEQPI